MTHNRRTSVGLLVAAVEAALLAGAAPATAANWNWQLPADRYKQLNAYERAQYDKAAELYKNGDYKAATAEFEKFEVQFQDSSSLSYMMLMRGLSLHGAKERNTAIKVYEKVLDHYGDQAEDAAPAVYFMGVAYLEDGDMEKGLKTMKKMVENDKYRKHPLAAGALRRLADNNYNNKEFELAVKYWKQSITDFAGVNDEERVNAVGNLMGYLVIAKDYTTFSNFFLRDLIKDLKPNQQSAQCRWALEELWNRAWGLYTWQDGWRFRRVEIKPEGMAKEQKALYEFFKTTKTYYEKAGDVFPYFERTLRLLVSFVPLAKDDRDALINDAVTYIKTLKEKPKQDNAYSSLIDICRDARVYDRARYLEAMMSDRLMASWKEYEILGHEGKWADAIKQLQTIEASGNADYAARALAARAYVYKDVTGEYEKAIKLYNDMNKPPGTLWSIAECYQRWNKLEKAMLTLAEIENSFPDQASRAAWYKAAYYDQAQLKKQAIAAARRLLAAYPKSGESSQAHLLLEKYKVKEVGGGVGDED